MQKHIPKVKNTTLTSAAFMAVIALLAIWEVITINEFVVKLLGTLFVIFVFGVVLMAVNKDLFHHDKK